MRTMLLALCAWLTASTCAAAVPITSIELDAAQSNAQQPFTVGLAFKKGDVPVVPALALANSQVIVKTRWNDGSVKFAIASGHAAVSANQPLVVAVNAASASSSAPPLTPADIQAANPSASVTLGGIGTVTLASLLATPTRVWLSGPELVEAHYRGVLGNDPHLAVWFHVRYYQTGRVFIRAVVENGNLDLANTDRTYIPTVSIGGATVFDNGGAALAHYANTRWSTAAWIGADASVRAFMDPAYLTSTRLVPNYMANTPPAATLDALSQTYAPLQNGNWTPLMGETGYQDQIGLLPRWDALYVTSHGDARAYRAVFANARALGSYPLVWTDSATHGTPTPSARANWTVDGPNQGGSTQLGAGSLQWDIAHHGSGGYLAYLVSGDYEHLQTMADQAALCYLLNSSGNGSGVARILAGQTRAVAWCLRTLSQYAALAPAGDATAADYRALLAANMAHWAGVVDALGGVGIGYFYEYDIDLYAPGTIAPWQQHFMMQALGMGSDLEPLADMSAYVRARDWSYRGAVGILGSAGGYCFNYASIYNAKISAGGNNDPASWYADWSTVFAATQGSVPCANTLLGNSGGDPASASTGYWGNLLPAIAYAVDHGAAGASASWSRLTGASNWSTFTASGFDSVPNWGVVPRMPVNPDLIFADSFEASP
jgi:hypothetical protein